MSSVRHHMARLMFLSLKSLCLVAAITVGCSTSSNDNGAEISAPPVTKSFKYTISNHTVYDIIVRHTNRADSDWTTGNSPHDNFNFVKIPSKKTVSRTEESAPYRSDAGREDIYLDMFEKGTSSYLFTSSISNFYVADNACHNTNYVMEVHFSDPRLRTVWMRASGESFLNVYPATLGGSDWMGGLDRNLTIAQLAIPGTHDSGAFDSSRACECQSNNPVQQLEMGVRSFDFRLVCQKDTSMDTDVLYLVHGDITNFGCTFDFRHKLEDYLNGFNDFLKNHPTESIMIHIKKESDPWFGFECSKETGLMLKDLLANMQIKGLDVMKDYYRFPTLGEAAGKVMLWYEPNVQACCDFPIKIDWDSETKHQEVYWGNSNARFIIQDAYNNSSSDKWDIVKMNLIEAQQHTDDQVLYYNYTSCVAGGAPNPAGEAENINEWFATWLSRNPDSGPLGCVIMDYINCGSFSGTGVTWYCNSGSHDLLPFMIYAAN
jgi:1-phosphatidylinositol phosphodiesterase